MHSAIQHIRRIYRYTSNHTYEKYPPNSYIRQHSSTASSALVHIFPKISIHSQCSSCWANALVTPVSLISPREEYNAHEPNPISGSRFSRISMYTHTIHTHTHMDERTAHTQHFSTHSICGCMTSWIFVPTIGPTNSLPRGICAVIVAPLIHVGERIQHQRWHVLVLLVYVDKICHICFFHGIMRIVYSLFSYLPLPFSVFMFFPFYFCNEQTYSIKVSVSNRRHTAIVVHTAILSSVYQQYVLLNTSRDRFVREEVKEAEQHSWERKRETESELAKMGGIWWIIRKMGKLTSAPFSRIQVECVYIAAVRYVSTYIV